MKMWMKCGTSAGFISLLILAAAFTGCTRKNGDDSSLKIVLPKSTGNQKPTAKKITAAQTVSLQWGLSDPTSVDQIGCYAVFVGGSDSALAKNSCSDSAGNQFTFGPFAGLAGRGQTLSLTVPSGTARRIVVVGLALAEGQSCESSFADGGLITFSRYSAPVIVGDVTQDLAPGDAQVTITESLTSFKISHCSFLKTGLGGLKALLLNNGDVIGPAGEILSASSPTNASAVGTDSTSILTADQTNQLNSGSSFQAPAHVSSLTRKPDSGDFYGLLHDGSVVKLDGADGYEAPATCPFAACKVPPWFQSISAGNGKDLFGLDHAGNVYHMKSDGTPEQLIYNFGAHVTQMIFY